PAPRGEERRPVRAEVILKSRIESDVALVVAEQVELDLIGAGACQVQVIERQAVGGNRRLVGYAVDVLPPRCRGREEAAKRVPIGLRRLLPIGADRGPALAQALFIGSAIL